MNKNEDQLYLVYDVIVIDQKPVQNKIKVNSEVHADKERVEKISRQNDYIVYDNFRICKGGVHNVVKHYPNTDRARLFIVQPKETTGKKRR